MSALGQLIDAAVASAISDHPKLFDPKQVERARKVLVREIMKTLTKEPKGEGEEQTAESELSPPQPQFVQADDPRARGYANLRAVAGAVAPRRASDGSIFLPPVAHQPEVLAFASVPARREWLFVSDRRQLTAWREFFADVLPGIALKEIIEERDGKFGALLPWQWPPSKTGKTYETAEEREGEAA